MSRIYLVKVGRSFTQPWRMKTIGAFDTAEEAEKFIGEKLQKGEHMYIEPVDKIGKKEFDDLMRTYTIINVKVE